jgi:hypothetical protein
MYIARSGGPILSGRFAIACALAVALSFTIGACGSPTVPTVTPPVVVPPVVVNTPPTIDSVAIGTTRVEAGQDVQVTASVKDAETPLDQLTYTWSASPHSGTFTGTGATVTWRPPTGETTPDLYTITLTVTEHYTSAGQPAQNVVSFGATVHYNDSHKESVDLAALFLQDFGTFTTSPAACVRNFSDNGRCAQEKADEFSQITNNRLNYHIWGSTFTATNVTFDAPRQNGVVDGPCVFEDTPNVGVSPPLPNAGKRELVAGICHLTTVYENFQWRLCVSNFDPPFNNTVESLYGRVPGHVGMARKLPE